METTAAAAITNFVSVQKQEDALIKIQSFIDKFENELCMLLNNQLSIIGPDEYLKIGPSELLSVLQEKKVEGIDLCLRNIFLESISKLNKKSNIASAIACLEACYIIKDKLQAKAIGYHEDIDLNDTQIEDN